MSDQEQAPQEPVVIDGGFSEEVEDAGAFFVDPIFGTLYSFLNKDIHVPASTGRQGGAVSQLDQTSGGREQMLNSILGVYTGGMDEKQTNLRSQGQMVKAGQAERNAAMQAAALHAAQARTALGHDTRAAMGGRSGGLSVGQAMKASALRRGTLDDIRQNRLETNAAVANIARGIAQAKADEGTARAALNAHMGADPYAAAASKIIEGMNAQWEGPGGATWDNVAAMVDKAVTTGSPAVIKHALALMNQVKTDDTEKLGRVISFLHAIPQDPARNSWVAAQQKWQSGARHYDEQGRPYRGGPPTNAG